MNISTITKVFFLLAFINIGITQGQSYTPFYLNHAEWTVSTIYPIIGPGDGGKVWKYRTLTDTLIGNMLYVNLTFRNLCEYYPDSDGNRSYIQNLDLSEHLIGGLREEEKKVYYYSFYSGEEKLIYDFDVMVGDTIFFENNNFTIILEELPPFNGHRKYKTLNKNAFIFPHETRMLIEGIGSTYGLFGSLIGGLNSLTCFSSDSQSINTTCAVCEGFFSTSATDLEKPNSIVKLAPNPAVANTLVTCDGAMLIRISVIDVWGVSLIDLQYSQNLEDRKVITLDNLNAGFYLVRVELNNHQFHTKRLIKMN